MAKLPKTPDFDPTDSDGGAAAEVAPEIQVEELPPSNNANQFASSARPHFNNFDAFYDHYVSERSHADNRRLQVIGMGLAALCLINVVLNGLFGGFWTLIWAAIFAFGSAAAGDHFIQKIRPTLLDSPAWSVMAQAKMFWETVTRKRAW